MAGAVSISSDVGPAPNVWYKDIRPSAAQLKSLATAAKRPAAGPRLNAPSEGDPTATFEPMLAPPSNPAESLGGGRIAALLDPHTARVSSTASAPSALVSSTEPLAVQEGANLTAIDLRLVDGGAWLKPANVSTDAQIPRRADGLFSVAGIGFTVEGAGAGKAEADTRTAIWRAGGDRASLVAQPSVDGLELWTPIPDATVAATPVTYRFVLPSGGVLRADPSGGASLVVDDRPVLTVKPPLAVDAAGDPVDVSFSVSGDAITQTVRPSSSTAWPILVDPYITDSRSGQLYNNSTAGDVGWVYSSPYSTPFYARGNCYAPVSCYSVGGGGYYIYDNYLDVMPPNYAVGWIYAIPTPGTTTYLVGASFDRFFVSIRDGAQFPYGYLGLGRRDNTNYEPLQTFSQTRNGAGVYLPGTFTPGDPGSNPVYAIMGFSTSGATSNTTRTAWRDMATDSVRVFLSDPENAFVNAAAPTVRWAKSGGTIPVNVTASDAGLGVKQVVVKEGTTVVGGGPSSPGNCTGLYPSPCPNQFYPVVNLAMGTTTQGLRSFSTTADDPLAGHTSPTLEFDAGLDTAAPVIGTLSGSLYDSRATSFSGARAVRVPLTGEGSTATPDQRRSGVKRIRLLVDGTVVADQHDFGQEDSWVPDNTGDDNILRIDASSLSAGSHSVVVDVGDWAGNTRVAGAFTITTAAAVATTVASTDTSLYGDVTGDGADDLVTVSSTGTVKVFPSDGSNTFGAGTTWLTWTNGVGLALGDVDGDGDDDLIGRTGSSADIRVALSTGTAFGAAAVWAAAAPAGTVFSDDVDVSGTDDLIIVQSNGTVRVGATAGAAFEAPGTWATLPAGSQPMFGDVSGDGMADLVVSAGGHLSVYRSTANAFAAAEDWGASPSGGLAVADADGDDTADVMVRTATGVVNYLPSSGTAFGAASSTTLLPTTDAFGVADVDGDLRADAIGRTSTAVRIHLGTAAYPTSDGSWAPSITTPEDPDDGDGGSDFAARAAVSGSSGLSVAWADDDQTSDLLQGSDEDAPDATRCAPAKPAFDRMRQTGATYLRMTVYWSKFLDGGAASTAYQLGLRNAVHCARASGLTPYMTITSAFYDSPTPHILNPSASAFRALVSAVVSEFYPLGVQRYSMWNEPNLSSFLQAGTCGTVQKDTASLYRELYREGYSAARAASNQGAIVYLGELSEVTRVVKPAACGANSKKGQSTLTFLQDVVDTNPHLVANGVAWHAYQHRSGPRTNSSGTGIFDIGRFQDVLSDLFQSHELLTPSGKKVGLYITEFGYFSVPFGSKSATGRNGPTSWTESQRATWLASAMNRAAQNGARMITFWQLNEAYPSPAAVTAAAGTGAGIGFDTGVLSNDGALAMNGSRLYGEGPNASWSNSQGRKAFCRVRLWATQNDKSPTGFASGDTGAGCP